KPPDRLARLHQQRLVFFEVAKLAHDYVERTPRARSPPRAAVNHEVVGALGHLGVEVVREHPQGGLLHPPLARQDGAAPRPPRSSTWHEGTLPLNRHEARGGPSDRPSARRKRAPAIFRKRPARTADGPSCTRPSPLLRRRRATPPGPRPSARR